MARITWLPHHPGQFMEHKRVDLIQISLDTGRSDIIGQATEQPGNSFESGSNCLPFFFSVVCAREKERVGGEGGCYEERAVNSQVITYYTCKTI